MVPISHVRPEAMGPSRVRGTAPRFRTSSRDGLFMLRVPTLVPRAGRNARVMHRHRCSSATGLSCLCVATRSFACAFRHSLSCAWPPHRPHARLLRGAGRNARVMQRHRCSFACAFRHSLSCAWPPHQPHARLLRGAGRNARVMQRHRRIVIPGEPSCETQDPGTQAKEVYWVPALQNCARAISPAGMTNDGMPTRATASANGGRRAGPPRHANGRLREVGVAVSKAIKSGPAARAAKELF